MNEHLKLVSRNDDFFGAEDRLLRVQLTLNRFETGLF
jgi:hypothetical protein